MNREQREVLKLLAEIDAVCKKYNIVYFLSPELTLCAENGFSFPQNLMQGKILLKIDDMKAFCQAVDKENRAERALESMENNPRFPGFYLRYVNTETLCCQLKEGENFQYPGIGIDIYPLRGKIASRFRHLWSRGLELGWQQTCYEYNKKPGLAAGICGLWVKAAGLFGGRKKLGRQLFQKFCREQSTENEKEYVVRYGRRKTYYFPAEMFEKVSDVILEGVVLQAPYDRAWYLRKVYGANYSRRKEEAYRVEPTVIASAMVSYKDFFREAGVPRELIRKRRCQYLKDFIGRRSQKYYNWCWNYAKLCAEKRKWNLYYEKNKDYIKNLYESRDYMRMEQVFRPYRKISESFAKEGESYKLEGELWEIYLDVLKTTGKDEENNL